MNMVDLRAKNPFAWKPSQRSCSVKRGAPSIDDGELSNCSDRGRSNLAHRSSFETIASEAATIPHRRLNLLGMLVASAYSDTCGGREVLRPLWETEAFNRASNFVRLVAMLDRNTLCSGQEPRSPEAETTLGLALSAGYRSLTISQDYESRSCSGQLHEINRQFVELFQPAFGSIAFESRIDQMALPASRLRASRTYSSGK
jgi:hypothetical protein